MISVSRDAKRSVCIAVALVLPSFAFAQPPAASMPVALALENQFDQPTNLADHRGSVVVLVYGDRKGTEACRTLGEQLHVCWHPDAKGQPPAKAQAAAVVPIQGVVPGQPSPDVRVIPVACCGKIPSAIRGTIRTQLAKAAPDVPVWIDFGDTMKATFGLTASEPNVAVFDASGRLRMKINGTPDQAALDRLVKAVETLRSEAANGK